MHRRPVAVVVIATLLALCLPLTLALATSAFAQEPEPPTGEPQPGEPEEPTPTPEEPTPTPEEPTGETPPGGVGGETGGGTLPRTGWDATLYFALGVILLLAGARLRVLTRIRDVGRRIGARVRRRGSDAKLRDALEPIRVARLSPPPPDPDPAPLHVEPSTPTAKRLTGVAARDE